MVLADELSEAQVKAFRLLANRSATWAEWDEELLRVELEELRSMDFDLEMTGFDTSELDHLLSIEDNAEAEEEEAIPEPPRDPVTRPGDLWILDTHRLLCGDGTKPDDVIRLMQGERAILFATDPPYLVDYDGTNHPQNQRHKANKAKGSGTTDGNKVGHLRRHLGRCFPGAGAVRGLHLGGHRPRHRFPCRLVLLACLPAAGHG